LQKYSENVFELKTSLPVHKAFLKLEIATDILRVELQYLFGCLMLDNRTGSQDLLQLLMENVVGSFGYTSSFLGVRDIDGTFYAVLSGYYLFHMKWNDKNIAEIVSLALSDIYVNFISWQWPDYVHVFSPQDMAHE
jgi:hypothetical protein